MNTEILFSSVMCGNHLDLKRELFLFEKNGVEYLHIDIMDGRSVPNYTLSEDFCKQLKKLRDRL